MHTLGGLLRSEFVPVDLCVAKIQAQGLSQLQHRPGPRVLCWGTMCIYSTNICCAFVWQHCSRYWGYSRELNKHKFLYPWSNPESYRNSGAGTAGLYSLLFDLRPCSPGARCRGPLPVLLAASRCIIQSHHSTQFLALNQQCALLFKKVKIIQFTDQASRRIQGIVDGFIIVLKEKGGGKETRLKRKSYVADSLEHFCSEPSEMFPVSLNSKG